MYHQKSWKILALVSLFIFLNSLFLPYTVVADTKQVTASNFGLPGIIDLPTAKRFPDGELVITHQNHKYLFMNGVSFQALPQLGLSFRYGGQGRGGGYAQGRVNWDRSFDAHIAVIEERKYFPAISFGLRDLIGTGWYSSEYIVGSKSLGKLELTAGLGFGRFAGRNKFSNPLGALSPRFDQRQRNSVGRGGTLGTINWFQGDASAFYGLQYHISDKITVSSEYTPDLMTLERSYLDVKSPWNFGASYQLNDYVKFSAQYLYGNQASLTTQIFVNPSRPPLLGGKELAPVPMRLRNEGDRNFNLNDFETIKKVLTVDGFEIHDLKINNNTVNILVTNTKFRSTAQAIGRVASTLQRFTSNSIKIVNISFVSKNLVTATYRVNLDKITTEQFKPKNTMDSTSSILAVDVDTLLPENNNKPFTWGLGPYIEQRLFNPDLPLSLETGIEMQAEYQITPSIKFSGALRKSVLTNFTDNKRRSNSSLPRVHSDWPLYDFEGQRGHIHELTLSYVKNLAPGLYGRAHAGFLEPFFAGFGGEMLYKPSEWPFGFGIDIHRVRKRDYDMRFDLLDYKTTVGHLNVYYDAGGMFDIEINAGRYLAGDWGATTKISRKFGSGWEVGGYATLTDVPFDTFGEGSFDKAIYVSLPVDWIISSPNRTRRRLTLRPITRDGGAQLSSSKQLYGEIKNFQNASVKREFGRLWK